MPKRFLTPLKEGQLLGWCLNGEMVEEYYQIHWYGRMRVFKTRILEKLELPEELIKVANAEERWLPLQIDFRLVL